LIEKFEAMFSDAVIEQAARESVLILRERKISARELLLLILFDPLIHENPTLRQHVQILVHEQCYQVSRQAVSKKFNSKAENFIKKLFEQFLACQVQSRQIPSLLKKKFTSVCIMDSTEFKLPDSLAAAFPGYNSSAAAACAAIQFEFDILSKKITGMTLYSARTSDKTFADGVMNNIQAGSLIIRD
jgi:hypothetical protein